MKISAYRINIGMMFLDAAIEYLRTAKDWILGAYRDAKIAVLKWIRPFVRDAGTCRNE